MPLRGIGLLNDERVSALRAPGRYSDGDRLYLHVKKDGYRQWIFRFSQDRKERVAGLGSPDGKNAISLVDARVAAVRLREQIAAGRALVRANEARQRMRALCADMGSDAPTLSVAAYARYFAQKRAPWRHHVRQVSEWTRVMRLITRDPISGKPITDVTLSDVLQILRHHARKDKARAERIRAALEELLNAAYSDFGFKRSNPARLRGNVERFMPREVTKAAAEKHSLTRKNGPDRIRSAPGPSAARIQKRVRPLSPQLKELRIFLDRLRLQRTVFARTIEFAALTALRLHDVLDLRWGHVSLAEQCLHLSTADPPARLKIPLSAGAMRIIRGLKRHSPDQSVFRTSRSRNGALAYHRAAANTDIPQIQLNSFRQLFSEWAAVANHDSGIAAARYLTATDSAVPLQQRAEMRMGEEVEALLVAWDQFLENP